jgi:hypothetical protein
MYFYINLFYLFTVSFFLPILEYNKIKNKVMKIITKEIKENGSEYIIYLVDQNSNPLLGKIVNKEEKKDLINKLSLEYNINDNEVIEMSHNEYINQ